MYEMDLRNYVPNSFNIDNDRKNAPRHSIMFTEMKLIGQSRDLDSPTDWTFYKLFAILFNFHMIFKTWETAYMTTFELFGILKVSYLLQTIWAP